MENGSRVKYAAIMAAGFLPLAAAVGAVTYLAAAPVQSDAHTDPNADIPWFFERTVLVQSGGRTLAGIIWDETIIVTTHHGLYNQTEAVVTDVRGNDIPATILYADTYSDVAVLAAYTGMEPLEMSTAGPGDTVYAVGHPAGRPYAITGGIISSVERHAPITIQHDAATSTGSSGGPLFDNLGRLVGMNTAVDDLSFAVPHEIMSAVIESVRSTGTYSPGCLGVKLDGDTVRTVRDRLAGVIRPGDVIMSVDGGHPTDMLYERLPGEVVEVVLEDRSELVRLGMMGKWFGIHVCRD